MGVHDFKSTEIKIFSDYEYSIQNQIYFENLQEKETYFNKLNRIYIDNTFSYVRDNVITVALTYEQSMRCVYMTYKNESENRTYYAQILNVEYENDRTSHIYFSIDWINTLDLNVGHNLSIYTNNCVVEREHVKNIANIKGLYSSVDTGTDVTINEASHLFEEFYVLILSMVELNEDYGDADNPKTKSASGQVYDVLPSGQKNYIIKNDDFKKLLSDLKDYPWITQNLTSITLVPAELVEKSKLIDPGFHTNLYTFSDNGKSVNIKLDDISFNMEQLREKFGLDKQGKEDELLRYPHSYIEILDYSGGYMMIDPAFLPETGLTLKGMTTLGSVNELNVFVDNYKSENGLRPYNGGEFLSNSITFENFPVLPVQIDNYQLALASTANSRKVAKQEMVFNAGLSALSLGTSALGAAGNYSLNNQRQISAFSNSDGSQSAMDSFQLGQQANSLSATTSALSLGTSAIGAAGNFYLNTQKQLASFEDKKISPTSLTDQSVNYANLIANSEFGIHVRFKQNQKIALNRVKSDFAFFGFPTKRIGKIFTPNNMSVVDFIKTSTINFNNNYVPRVAINNLDELFSLGVHFWHDSVATDILNNSRK